MLLHGFLYVVWLFTLFAIFLLSREASNSILHFLADIFDLANSSVGEQFIPIRDSVIIPRGASITRILVASLTGALLKSRVDVVISLVNIDCLSFTFRTGWSPTISLICVHLHLPQVSYTVLALSRSYGMQALEWEKKSVLLIPSTVVTDVLCLSSYCLIFYGNICHLFLTSMCIVSYL